MHAGFDWEVEIDSSEQEDSDTAELLVDSGMARWLKHSDMADCLVGMQPVGFDIVVAELGSPVHSAGGTVEEGNCCILALEAVDHSQLEEWVSLGME